MRIIPTIILMLCAMLCACTSQAGYDNLQKSLSEFTADKDATIGIAVIIDGKDTVAVNGNRHFPMLSVYKFPIAVALSLHYRENNLSLDYPVAIMPEDLHPDTYSPMTEKILASSRISTDTLRMPTRELLSYMLRQSDNNASDIILKAIGDRTYVERLLLSQGVSDIKVKNSEAEMHADNSLCYANSATPLGMVRLVDKFQRDYTDPISLGIKRLMETCHTGADRLAKPFAPTNVVIGHKTGTGFTLPDGRLMAVNDVGYVRLPDGRNYSIAVFIENSGYDMAHTEALIAEISEIVWTSITPCR